MPQIIGKLFKEEVVRSGTHSNRGEIERKLRLLGIQRQRSVVGNKKCLNPKMRPCPSEAQATVGVKLRCLNESGTQYGNPWTQMSSLLASLSFHIRFQMEIEREREREANFEAWNKIVRNFGGAHHHDCHQIALNIWVQND